jgi:hypothetical protein
MYFISQYDYNIHRFSTITEHYTFRFLQKCLFSGVIFVID